MIRVEIKNWSGTAATVMVGMEDYTVPEGTHMLVVDDVAQGMTNIVMVDWNGNMDTLTGSQGWQLTSGVGMPMVYERPTEPGAGVEVASEFMLIGLGAGAVIAVSAMMIKTVKRVLGTSATYD